MYQSTADPLIGTTVAHYEVLAKIGGGGMGVVYAARDTRLGRRVALKFLPAQWSHDDGAKERFIREAQAASATDHRNICTIHDIDTAPDGRLFIVMAHYDGPTLKQRLESGPLSVDEAIEIAAQTAEGLARAHAQGIVHRDVKPGNLIVTEDGVRILDFGLARFVGSLHLTLDGSTLGTVAYMSPEQSRGEDADGRSDVWSVGIVLYEMVTGELPFKGAYAEAIGHAIRTHPTPALRTRDGDHIDPLERVVRRALEKDPAQRYQSALDLARDLRLLQGRTLPIDLRTGVVPAGAAASVIGRRRGRTRRRLAAAAAVVAVGAGVVAWLLMPADRVAVVVAPVVNQTGYADLEPYRLALTQELASQLLDSRVVRVVPYDRLLQSIRRFRARGDDVSSREALQAIAANAGASVILVPTLLYDDGSWRARVEFRDPTIAVSDAAVETAPVVSSLPKETARSLMTALARAVDSRFLETGPSRQQAGLRLRQVFAGEAQPAASGAASLDVALAFEKGLDAYDRLEYGEALRSFGQAAESDQENALIAAWQSRAAWMMRQDRMAVDAGDRAVRLVSARTPVRTALFAQAVAAEARRDNPTAETRYRQMAERYPDEPHLLLELAGLQDRTTQNREAIGTYQRALSLGAGPVKSHVELCRLYNRINESASARQHAQDAIAAARKAADQTAESQALFCLVDALRVGTPEDREQTRTHAERALQLLSGNGARYQLTRAYYYQGVSAYTRGAVIDAIAAWQNAADRAREDGNLLLEPLLLMNIGVAEERLGQRSRAADAYQSAYRGYERLGDNARAAQIQANRGALLIEWGDRPDDGRREVENALAVARKLGDRNFETFCLQVMAAHDRYAGRHGDAIRTLNQALALSRERDLKDDIASLTIDLARSEFDRGNDMDARRLLSEALGDGNGPHATEARLRLARVLVRMGDPAAERELRRVADALASGGDAQGLTPLLHLVEGERAYRQGHTGEARQHFTRAVAFFGGEQPDAAAVEARMYLGILDLDDRRFSTARTALETSLEQAQRMGRYRIQVAARTHLARLAVAERRLQEADSLLQPLPADVTTAVGPDLQSQIANIRRAAELR